MLGKSLIKAAAGNVSTGNPNAWDVSYAVYDAGAAAGDVSKSVYTNRNFSMTAQDSYPKAIYIKSDGLSLYSVMSGRVWQYTLSNVWSIRGATYASKNFLHTSEVTTAEGLFFKSDGTKMYLLGIVSIGSIPTVFQYSLSTAWDVSTASYDSVSFVTAEATPRGLFFKPDGTKMYITGTTDDDVKEYSLSSAWDLSTASYVQNFSVSTQEATPSGVSFLEDGATMYIVGTTGDDINQYSLSTPWDVSTASYVQNFSVSGQSSTPNDVFFKPDGTMFFIVDEASTNATVFEYMIGSFSVATEETAPVGLFFKPDGTKMYVLGDTGNDVNEYDLSTAWDISTASYVQRFAMAGQDSTPADLFFKSDGLKMYMVGATNDYVYEYDLSVAWDVSTASYLQFKNITPEDGSAVGLFFKPDGTKMYMLGRVNDAVFQYSLSTAWDVSTASYDSVSFSVASQENASQSLSFKPDGTKMYITGGSGDDINEYDLSTPWDVSSASYVQTKIVFHTNPTGLYWRDNGEEFFIVGSSLDRVTKYAISPT